LLLSVFFFTLLSETKPNAFQQNKSDYIYHSHKTAANKFSSSETKIHPSFFFPYPSNFFTDYFFFPESVERYYSDGLYLSVFKNIMAAFFLDRLSLYLLIFFVLKSGTKENPERKLKNNSLTIFRFISIFYFSFIWH
jgi:hypothetical protein